MQVVRHLNFILFVLKLAHGGTMASMNVTTSKRHFSLEGCFQKKHIDMNNFYLRLTEYDMTLGKCYKECSYIDAKFLGLKYGTDCYCGFSITNYNKVDKKFCSIKCSGNSEQACGSYFSMSIYRVESKTSQKITTTTIKSYIDKVTGGNATGLMRGLLIFFGFILFIVLTSLILRRNETRENRTIVESPNQNTGVQFNAAFNSDPISVIDESGANSNRNDLPSYEDAIKGKY